MVIEADAKQILCLKSVLTTFYNAIGLKVNYHKSNMIPINLNEESALHFTQTMQCQLSKFPITYLGIPLGIHKPRVEHCLPLVNRIAAKLNGVATFLTYAGRLIAVKSILSSMVVYHMTCLDLPETVKQ